MGIVYSTALHKMKRFNVENRAQRAIEMKKRKSAPKHPSSIKFYDKIIRDSPEVYSQLKDKDMELNKLLKEVYVTSPNSIPEFKSDSAKLPQERRPQPEDDFGFKLPSQEELRDGHINLKDAITFITDHRGDPQLWTPSAIAIKHKLDKQIVGDILEYFRSYDVHVTKTPEDKGGMYSITRMRDNSMKYLLPDEKEADGKDLPKQDKS